MRVFISYSRKNIDAANQVADFLRARSVDVFIDYQEILGTDHFPERLAHEIDGCDALLLLLSADSMVSRWVIREVEYADEQQKPIVILRLDQTPLPKAIFYLARREQIDGSSLTRTGGLSEAAADKLARTLGLTQAPELVSTSTTESRAGISKQIETPAGSYSASWTPPPTPARQPAPFRWMGLVGLVVVAAAAVIVLLPRSNDGNVVAATSTSGATSTVDAESTATFTPSPSATAAETAPPENDNLASEIVLTQMAATDTDEVGSALTEQALLLDVMDSLSRLTDWQPELRNFDGVSMVRVPQGCFTMGSDALTDLELPIHPVCVEEFWIDRFEVSNEQFDRFGGSSSEPSWDQVAAHPRINLSWSEAREYCALRGARLPTEVEWEFAARGPFGWDYPWGIQFDSLLAAVRPDGPVPVQSLPEGASWVGALQMAGNAAEWTSSRSASYPYDPDDDRENSETDSMDQRVLRGGAFITLNTPELLMSAARNGVLTQIPNPVAGVRCARDG
jgi:iron(II)-dependent oxidoreductase